MYARPEIEGNPTTLGVSGKLWRDALVMYDRETNTLWTQISGRALAGPLEGQRLEEIPSEQATWAAWKSRHPDTLVLVKPPLSGSTYRSYHENPAAIGVRGTPNPDRRLPGKTLVLGIEIADAGYAMTLEAAESTRLTNIDAGGVPLLIAARDRAVRIYDRRVDGRALSFEPGGEDPLALVRDRETGSTWNATSGLAVEGPLEGKALQPLPVRIVYWGVWAQFHRESEILRP